MSDMTLPEVEISTQPRCAQMDLVPAMAGPRAESPLHHADLAGMKKTGAGSVHLQEQALLGHLVLRGSLTNAAFLSGFEQVMGFALPGPLQSAEEGDSSVRWIAPDEWLLVVPGSEAFGLEKRLREVMNGHFSIVNASGGQTVLMLSGENAINVLKKSSGYDFHDSNFPIGKAVTTTFAKTQAVIRRVGNEQWELVVRRSFADYVWLWLQDSSAEYGLILGN